MKLDRTATGFRAHFEAEKVVILVRRIRESHDSTYAEIEVRYSNSPEIFLTEGNMNLSGPRIRQQWADDLEKLKPIEGSWRSIFEQLSRTIIRSFRSGNPVQVVMSSDATARPEWALDPLIRRFMPNALFGDGNAAKSIMALTCVMISQHQWHQNPIGLRVPRQMDWLYLDWEASQDEIEWRWRCLHAGAGLDPIPLSYRYCEKSLASEVEGVMTAIEDCGAEGVVIDSLGMAAGGDLNATQPAFDFFQALRSLKTREGKPMTSLFVAHNAKDRERKERSIYGNYYYSTQTRNIWEQRATTAPGRAKQITLLHNKWNTTVYHDPISTIMEWDEAKGVTRFLKSQLPVEMSSSVPTYKRAHAVLLKGPLRVEALAERLGMDPSDSKMLKALAALLYKYDGLFRRVDDEWGAVELHRGPGQGDD